MKRNHTRTPASFGGDGPGAGLRAFTLLELLIAVSVFAIVLASINAVFFSALRLRNRSAAMIDKTLPIEHALTIIQRDLSNIVPPGTMLAGQLQTSSSSNGMAGASTPVFYCTTGIIDNTTPFAEIQKISFTLAESTNRYQGKDLVRLVQRNLLAATEEAPLSQILMGGVQAIAFTFYDGSQWRDSWDSTVEDPKLPRGIKLQVQFAPDSDNFNAPARPPLELVIPVLVASSTNTTAQTTNTGGE